MLRCLHANTNTKIKYQVFDVWKWKWVVYFCFPTYWEFCQGKIRRTGLIDRPCRPRNNGRSTDNAVRCQNLACRSFCPVTFVNSFVATCQVFWPLFVRGICSFVWSYLFRHQRPVICRRFSLYRCRLESNLKSSVCLFQVNCSWQFPFKQFGSAKNNYVIK